MDFSNLPFETVIRAYPKWLKCAYNYYYEELYDEEMSDEMWTGLGYYYVKHLDKIPFLKEIEFQGSTLGCGVDRNKLLEEINKHDNKT